MLLDAALDLLLPRHCVGCGARGTPWCDACTETDVLVEDRDGLPVASAVAYAGAARTAVLAYKERGRRDLAPALATALATAVRALEPAAPLLLVPVPSSTAAARSRGGDHVRRLAQRAAPLVPARALFGALRLVAAVHDSAGLGAAARQANLAHAMRAQPPPRAGVRVVLVDDVVTTGATVREAVRALTAAGWQVVGAATVARTVLRCESAGRRLAAPHTPGRTAASGLT